MKTVVRCWLRLHERQSFYFLNLDSLIEMSFSSRNSSTESISCVYFLEMSGHNVLHKPDILLLIIYLLEYYLYNFVLL